MGTNKRRQSAPVLPDKLDASMPEEITDDDIYEAFGVKKNDSSDDPKLDTSTPRRSSKKKVKKRQSAPVKRMSIYDILYEEEVQYKIPKGVFDVDSPPTNEKQLKRPKSTGKPVEAKIPHLNQEPSLFELLVSPRENKDNYDDIEEEKIKSKELVADFGTPTLDDDEETSEPPSENLPIPNDEPVAVRPISMTTKRDKGTKKKVRSKSLVIDLGEPPMAVANSPESLSASDSQILFKGEYPEIKSDCTTKRSKKTKKARSKSLVIDLGEPPVTVAKSPESLSASDSHILSEDEYLEIKSGSTAKRNKKTKKVRSNSLVIDLGEPPMAAAKSPESLSASDNQLLLKDEYLEIESDSTTKRRKKTKKDRSNSLAIDLGDPPLTVAETVESKAYDLAPALDEETLDIRPSSMTKRHKNAKKTKSRSPIKDLGNPIVKNECMKLLRASDIVVPLNDESFDIGTSQSESKPEEPSRDGLDQEILPRRRCRSHSPHARMRNSMVHWGMNELHIIEESSEESDDDRWSSHSRDSPPHAPRKRRKRHKSCTPPLARSPNRLWLDSFEVNLQENGENKTKKVKKKRKSKEKSIEKSADAIKKPNAKLANDPPDASPDDENQKPSKRSSLDSNASSKDSKKGSPKKKRKSTRKDSNRMSTSSMDSSIDDSVEKPSSRSSLDSNASSKSSRKENPKKKRKSSRKSTSKVEPSLHDSMEFHAQMVAAEEEARRKAELELAKLRAEEEARRQAEQEAASARLKLKVAEAQRKVEEEDQMRAERKARKQAKEGAIMRAQEEARRNAEMEGERQRLKAEQERLQQERAEIQRLRKAEQDRLEKERAELQRQKEEEAERLAKERADLERCRFEEEQRLQREKEKQERQLLEEKARIKAEHEATKARLKAEQQEHERLAKEDKLRQKAEKQGRNRLAREEKARIKAEKAAELAKIKAEKEAEKGRIKAEKEAEMARIRRDSLERQMMAEAAKAQIEAEKEAEMKRQEEEADQEAEEAEPLKLEKKLEKPSLVGRNYSVDSLLQGSIDNSLHADAEAERLIKDRQQLERDKANLERQKKAAAERLKRRAEAIRAAVRAERARSSELDAGMHGTQERYEEQECTGRRKEGLSANERRERAPSPEAVQEAKQRRRKEASIRKQEKRRRMEEKAAEDYCLGKLDGRRSIAKNDRQFGSSWNKILVS